MTTFAGFIEPTTHIPYFCRNGNRIVKEWVEDFDDGCGHRGKMTMLIYYDKKKNKNSDPVMKYIKWENILK